MARTKKVVSETSQENVVETKIETKVNSLPKFKVTHPVLGYKVGEIIQVDENSIKFQLKHKSIVRLED